MIKTKEIEFVYGGCEYIANIDYESNDGTICAVLIDGDVMELLRYPVMERIEEVFSEVDEDE